MEVAKTIWDWEEAIPCLGTLHPRTVALGYSNDFPRGYPKIGTWKQEFQREITGIFVCKNTDKTIF